MNENIAAREVEDDGVKMIDLGDAMVETKQPHPIHDIKDNHVSWTYAGI
ncbi:hypothetical protein JM946_28310 [Steroidobacter sp. S1-65]|uniref:Uncharacterized protein n=1 Tax=Steroidobacter gossypii TaxID=2805490 RepID=A0ABS1X619_9GAMM|nr:hypothetical protein [Steroidobacter gossypii]MBM0108653.1 hypothetical protein [Steroidobacter gossypii]